MDLKGHFLDLNCWKMAEDSESTPETSAIFNSSDFRLFLSKEMFNKKGLVLSKDSALPDLDTDSVFKSKESFSGLFASTEWNTTYLAPPKEERAPSALGSCDEQLKSFPSSPNHVSVVNVAEDPLQETANEPDVVQYDILKSKDWMPYNTLGTHVDVEYSKLMFSSESLESAEIGMTSKDGPKTQWDQLFLSQLVPPQSSSAASQILTISSLSHTPNGDTEHVTPPSTTGRSGVTAKHLEEVTRKRKRSPRKKVIPSVKMYVEPNPLDVLCGRGGRSNHHPGNKRYREEIDNLKEWYNNTEDKDEKTDLSQCLVDYIQSYGGRFLERDKGGWYVVDNIVARRKSSQALREDNDPAKRQAKRQRFLAKRARLQEEARREEILKG